MLEAEGVVFDASGCCSLEKYLWIPKGSKREPQNQTLFKKALP
jgi:hypothetical protein